MARSSLLGVDSAAAEPAGRDKASLGPGDNSDSGSDVAGLDSDEDAADPGLPVDVALRDDQASPLPLGESLPSSEGEAGVRDGADIGVDRVFSVGDVEDSEALPQAVDDAPVSEDEEDEEDEEVAQADATAPASRRRANAAPSANESEERPGDADADSSHRPGRS